MAAKQQRGLSLILLVFLIALVGIGLIVNFLPFSNYATETSMNTTEALEQAKEAVVGNVIGGFSGSNPGQFPCFENISSIGTINEGQVDGSCSKTNVSVGRFAWRTLGTGDIRYGNTDNLWYALSPGFRANPINSDTIAGLGLNGSSEQAIAILFSPGPLLSGQVRPTPSASNKPNVINYLDGENNNGNSNFVTGSVGPSFNDKLVLIKPDDIYPLLEKRVLSEVKNYLLTYKALWGAYPYPAPFGNPYTTSYVGSINTTGGLLPVADAGISWNGSSNCYSMRTSDGFVTNGTVVINGKSLVCTINAQGYSGARTVLVSADLNNVALGFYQQMDMNSSSDFSFSPTSLKSSTVLSYGLNAAGGGTIKLWINTSANTSSYVITFKQPPDHDDWNTTVAIPNYIFDNNWQQLLFYKVAAPFLPGGNGVCGACLIVNKTSNLSATPVPQADIHALLISAGRKLPSTEVLAAPVYNVVSPAQIRPGTQLTDYFDSINNTTDGTVFDSKHLPLSNFNDQLQVVE